MLAQDAILSGRYLLKEELGSGGMGTVYRAVDLRTGADVAVKVPHRFLARDKAYMERLRREAEIAASLSSPRVARVTDFAEHDGTPYLVMEFVPGETLAAYIDRQGELDPMVALRITLEIARALDAAHQRGITHRDLKPQNIHIDGEDVKVLDFGLAHLEGQTSLTQNSVVTGSPEYMAPERVEGLSDIRSDLYGLGIVLYEMLAGKVPFDGGTPWTVMRRHASDAPPPLPEGLTPSVQQIVEKLLAKRPEDRYQTPRELITALQDAIRTTSPSLTAPLPPRPAPPPFLERTERYASPVPNGGPGTPSGSYTTGRTDSGPMYTPADQTTTRERSQSQDFVPSMASGRSNSPPPTVRIQTPPRGESEPKRKAPWLLLAAGGVAIAAVVAGAVIVLGNQGSDTPSGPGSQVAGPGGVTATAVPPTGTAGSGAGPTATPGTTAPPTGEPPAVTILYPAEGATVTSPVRVEVKVERAVLRPPTDQDQNARHLHYFLDTDPAAVLGPGVPIPIGQQSIIHSPATTHLGNFGPGKHTVYVVLTDNNHVALNPNVQVQVTFNVEGTPARSGSQAPVVYQSLVDGKWRLFTVRGDGRDGRRISRSDANEVEPAWSPDGGRIAFASDMDGKFHIYTMNADGSNVVQLTSGDSQNRSPAWSPDGTQIAFASNRQGNRDQIYVAPAGGGTPRQVTRSDDGGSGPTWSPDGKQIAYYGGQGSVTHIFVVDAAGGEPKRLTSANQRHIDPDWSPDGRRIAFVAFRDNRWNVFIMAADGSDVQQVTNEEYNQDPAWSPDGLELVFVSGREGQQQAFALPLAGGPTRRLTEGLAQNFNPSWPRK
jgi:eukaryotic-like serine/threonine-protein kinase